MQKFYIAFSIHGSNAFITATKETDKFILSEDGKKFSIDGLEFNLGYSRDPNYNFQKQGYKLLSDRLLTKDRKPLRSHPMILKFFNELEDLGWEVTKDRFLQKHWKK